MHKEVPRTGVELALGVGFGPSKVFGVSLPSASGFRPIIFWGPCAMWGKARLSIDLTI